VGATVWHDLFPELFCGFRKVRPSQYKDRVLLELEKLLRRVKLLFSTVERVSDTLIKKVRREHRQSTLAKDKEKDEQDVRALHDNVIVSTTDVADKSKIKAKNDTQALKTKEQQLIIKIAQSPKDVVLYKDLGDVYMKMKSFRDAFESFDAATKIDPKNEALTKKRDQAFEKSERQKNKELL
jgi:predicted Zn-dependent protease